MSRCQLKHFHCVKRETRAGKVAFTLREKKKTNKKKINDAPFLCSDSGGDPPQSAVFGLGLIAAAIAGMFTRGASGP